MNKIIFNLIIIDTHIKLCIYVYMYTYIYIYIYNVQLKKIVSNNLNLM